MIIDWAYLKNGCDSCQKAIESLGHRQVVIKTKVNARHEPMEAKKTWDLLQVGKKILIASGPMTREYYPLPDNKKEILKIVLGRNGILRAPTLKIGSTFYIGFNNSMYERLLNKR